MAVEAKLLDHLSREIVSQTKDLMTFRARINFAVFIGPFVLLGSLLYGGKWAQTTIMNWWIFGAAFLFLILSYLTMGWACASIEIHVWKQCNKWRSLIADVSSGKRPLSEVTPQHLEFKEKLRLGYWVVYGAMTLAFICALVMISQMRLISSP
jgi:hypothetical protein